MNSKKLIGLISVFIVAIVAAIFLSASISSTTYTWLAQQCDGIYNMPNLGDCMSYAQFPQWELDDLNHVSSVGLWLLWLGIGITVVLSLTVFRRIALSTVIKWSVLSIGLVIAVLLPLLTWRSIIDPTYVYASALSLPIGLLSISLFLMPQKKVHITSASQKEPAKPDQELLALQQAVQANPQSFEAWTDLAYRQHKLDLNNDALASANKALALNKRYGRAWMVRGAALSTMDGQEDIALEALDRALREEQNNVDTLYYMARVFMFQEKNDEAHGLFDRVIALDPTYKDAYVGKNILYSAINDLDSVLAIADKYIGRFPDDPVGWRMQGVAYNLQGEDKWEENIEEATALLNKAILSFNKALDLNPADSSIYLVKAGPFVDLGDYSQALKILNQGLSIDPDNRELQEAKQELLHKRTARIAGRVGRKAGSIALGGGKGLAKGSFQAGKLFWKEIFRN